MHEDDDPKPAERIVVRSGVVSAEKCASLSRATFQALLTAPEPDLELLLLQPDSEAVVRGAFQNGRPGDLFRASGGAEVVLGPGVLQVILAIPEPWRLVSGSPDTLLNRFLRPLLKAMTRAGCQSSYFGRDWISAAPARRPVALTTFAHDAASQKSLIEAFVAVSHPVVTRVRESYLGKEPATFAELGSAVPTVADLADLIAHAYATAFASSRVDVGLDLDLVSNPARVAVAASSRAYEGDWTVTVEDAIGTLGAARESGGRIRVGGDLLISHDALAQFEVALERARSRADVEAAAEALAEREIALLGVRPSTLAELALALGVGQ